MRHHLWACLLLMGWVIFPSVRIGLAADPAPAAGGGVFTLDQRLLDPAFWQKDAEGLAQTFRKSPFSWVSNEKTELRAAGARMRFLGLPVVEAVIRVADGKPSEVFLSLYNRGDLGRIDDEQFEEFVLSVETTLTTHAGGPMEDMGDAFKRTGIRASSRAWATPTLAARLDTAYSRVRETGDSRRQDRPEFVNLTVFPPGTPRDGMQVQRKADTALVDFSKRLEKKPDGDVVISGIPMVDQGQKGYCAVATMERILRYYGSEVNQHELAQQAHASGEGTNPEQLLKALKAMGGKVGLRVDERITSDTKDFFELVDDYNKVAKRKDARVIQLPSAGVIYISEVYAAMSVPVLRDVRLKSASKVEKFFGNVSETIEQGRPLAWNVQLGWVEETPKLPQATGGHMRLIVGYNPQKKEILYSDSWGFGHELKRMSLEDAYLITTGLFVVEPRS